MREGILLKADGRWGEAAPLPGWSSETLPEIQEFLHHRQGPVPASLRCALESLESDWPLLREEVPLNALLDGSALDVLAGASRAFDAGCRCLKIKTSGLDLGGLPGLLETITAQTGRLCKLRLDPNRAWTLDQTLHLAEQLQHLPIEYLEEPLANADEWPNLISRCVCPVALDETLREISPSDLRQFTGVAALVLKPTLIGGFSRCREFAIEGERLGMVSVVSAAYESGVGIHALGRFAASLSSISAAGLDTYSRLASDVLVSRIDLSGFVFRSDQQLPALDESLLVLL